MKTVIMSAVGFAYGVYIGHLGYHIDTPEYWALAAFFASALAIGGVA